MLDKFKIGIIAPSFFIEREDNFKRGIQCLEDLGATLCFGNTVFSRCLNTTGTAKDRADDINKMFADPGIDIIIATDGGCRGIETLEHLDYDLIQNNQKTICGFSDISHILSALSAKTDNYVIHGPDIIHGFGAEDSVQKDKNIEHLIQLLKNESNIIFPQSSPFKMLKHGQAHGKIVGGWLESIHNLHKTEYFPKYEKPILFWEAVDTELNKINLILQSLRLSGFFENLAGMVIGKLTNCDEKEYFDCSPTLDNIIMDACKGYDFPIITNTDFGHGPENIAFQIGSNVSIDTKTNTIILNQRN